MDALIFPIHPPSPSLFRKVLAISFIALCAIFVILALVIYSVIDIEGPVGQIAAPVALGSMWAMMLFIVFTIFTWSYYVAKKTAFAVLPSHLVINNSAHGKNFKHGDLRPAEARIVDLESEPQYRPNTKLFGINTFFYHGGSFRLHSKEKAHVFYAGSQRLVYIPTNFDHALLLGPADPEGFLAALQSPAPEEA